MMANKVTPEYSASSLTMVEPFSVEDDEVSGAVSSFRTSGAQLFGRSTVRALDCLGAQLFGVFIQLTTLDSTRPA